MFMLNFDHFRRLTHLWTFPHSFWVLNFRDIDASYFYLVG